jgi:hypothetical protein
LGFTFVQRLKRILAAIGGTLLKMLIRSGILPVSGGCFGWFAAD